MKLDMSNQMRLEQRMKLAPRMIQSMEILQLSTLALLEKIETELNSNPVLEMEETEETGGAVSESEQQEINQVKEQISSEGKKEEDYSRLEDFSDDSDGYFYRTEISKPSNYDDTDKKFEAMNNTPDTGLSLNDYLNEQWRLVDADEKVKKAGEQIIDYIDEKGYLKVRLEQLHNKDRNDFSFEDLEKALKLVQELEPAGIGARDVKECLLIQMAQSSDDWRFERELVSKHLDKLLENKLPEIAKKMNCSVERINEAIARLRKFDTSPGMQISRTKNPPIKADVLVEPDSDGGFKVTLADRSVPSLRINEYYSSMAKDRKLDTKTRQFLNDNIRSAKWLMDAITQRKHTLLKVSRAVVESQTEFFEKGKLYLKPLPMSEVADKIGVHVATVSRAVAGKYIQSPQGLMPLRDLFGGGMESSDGGSESFEAIRAKMQQIIDSEDKSKPLSDDAIKKKLEQMGVKDIARRTVAKYRKIMKIPTARFRKKF
ncbi:MAG: RNA polymerase sigma-54 factor [Planctomycetes bacterium GWF2_41_51]|nr:MAG: RNA polymerase sigma-54 factor [Planctomycetes bacterium GWF2_41_51]HBG28377.1 RNA polymerase sigma-54 factor [Phycisphaerales bacterium]